MFGGAYVSVNRWVYKRYRYIHGPVRQGEKYKKSRDLLSRIFGLPGPGKRRRGSPSHGVLWYGFVSIAVHVTRAESGRFHAYARSHIVMLREYKKVCIS